MLQLVVLCKYNLQLLLKPNLSLLQLMVCNDSGPRHVAIGLNVPTICIMGPTKPVYTEGPYEKGRVLRVDVDSGPRHKPTGPTDHRRTTPITRGARLHAGRTNEAPAQPRSELRQDHRSDPGSTRELGF